MNRVDPRPSHELRCSYCHGSAVGVDACPGCGTLTHSGCRAEVGGCVTIGCRAATATRARSDEHSRKSRLGARALTGMVLAGVCLLSAFAAHHDESFGLWWASAIVLFWGSVLGFGCSLLFVAAALVSEALCFVLNDRRPAGDRLR